MTRKMPLGDEKSPRGIRYFTSLRKKLHLIALHHAVETAVRAQEVDGGGGDVGAGGEILDGDEAAVLARLDDCLRRLLPHARECGERREEGVLSQDEFLRIGCVEINGVAGEAAQVHLPCELEHDEDVLLLVVELAAMLTRLGVQCVDCRLDGFLSLRDDVRVELIGADGEIRGVVGKRIMHLAEGDAVAHHDVGGRVGAREEVFDLLAGLDVPLGDAARAQLFYDVRSDAPALSHVLHGLEREQRLDAVLHEVVHDIIARRDRVL